MVSDSALRSGHWPGLVPPAIKVSLTFVAETNAYVPSNCVTVVGGERSAHSRRQRIRKIPQDTTIECTFACACPPVSRSHSACLSLLGLFLPNQIITATITGLACAYRAVAVDPAADGCFDTGRYAPFYGLGMTSHDQLALRSDRSFEHRQPRLAVGDDQRGRFPVRTLAYTSCSCRRVGFIHFCGRHERVGAVELAGGGRRRWGLRIGAGEQAKQSDDP